jgi:hypothetical protein
MKKTLLNCLAAGVILFAIGAQAQTKPTLVQEVDIPAKRAFQISASVPANTQGSANLVTTVPPTRRWVIEHIDLHCYTASNFLIYKVDLQTTVMGAVVNHALPLLPQGNGDHYQHYSALYNTKLYADGGSQIHLTARSTHPQGGQCSMSISGYWFELLALPF